jgi:hypothetical protein
VFRAVVQYTGNQAAGSAHFQMSAGSGSASSPSVSAIFFSGSTFGSGQQTAALGGLDSPTLSTSPWTAIIEGQSALTDATLSLQAAVGTSGDTFSIADAFLMAWRIA